MKIIVTVINSASDKKFDVQIDDQQRIKTTIRVLSENIEEFSSFQNIEEIQIKESGRRISTELTYKEADIYTGTEILLKGETKR